MKVIAPAFAGLLRRSTAGQCEAWAIARAKEVAPRTFAKELEIMRGAFRYATAQGLILRDPSANLKRPKLHSKPPSVPTREHFAAIVAAIRTDAQGKGDDGAGMVELLAYSAGRDVRAAPAGREFFTGGFHRRPERNLAGCQCVNTRTKPCLAGLKTESGMEMVFRVPSPAMVELVCQFSPAIRLVR